MPGAAASQPQPQPVARQSSNDLPPTVQVPELTEVLDATSAVDIQPVPAAPSAGAAAVQQQTVQAGVTVDQTVSQPAPIIPLPVEQAAAPAVALPPPLLPGVDPEFLELFIEEAHDEIERLQELLPRWEDNPQDQDALVGLRRSFHTLKGSGRMVGAQLIGEFAWSLENLLNRVLSKTLTRSPAIMTLLRSAAVAVPELVGQLQSGTEPTSDIAALISMAQQLAEGRQPAAGAVPATPPSAEKKQSSR